ncbi:MAG: aldehyde reductase [Chlorobium sp.]|uniref:SDR family oxidoreductase n=1 Tax=Chlorobium sp. TaxID=1095 RepID=UPI0025C5D7C5|nr:aldehyde reductase [Chlorobium sp.]MCF8217064.1 aldehyde reductase [Chlorobium sp.]MCF8271885.1 aldehyde reductase [Chlorobium sp.]MCF8288281.1 aldehyde reductase [Chlorobium sp.]MCF8291847.1 aldehyde reductase [Chlorobium sp.]MCF8385961.1 aldehyde reductase [Chlorobium sp.]
MITDKPVCVTGASGFIASHIVAQLLHGGYRVRGTVRKSPDYYPYLQQLPGANERLELVKADLLSKESFLPAFRECEYIIHTASPYVINVKNPAKDLVEPSLQGTLGVMEAAAKTATIRRVILTSSVAAVTDEPDSTKVFTERDWNTLSSLDRHPYHYSKTLAERAAWEFVDREKTAFDLISINPSMVTGPSLGPDINTTNAMIRDIMSGVYPGIMDLNWGFVDVRDTARAHILAMETSGAAGRYLCSAGLMEMRKLVELLSLAGYGDYPLPNKDLTGRFGTALMTALSFTQPRDTGTYIRTHIGRSIRYGCSKIKQELGISFMPVMESILEAVEDMIRKGHLVPPPSRSASPH